MDACLITAAILITGPAITAGLFAAWNTFCDMDDDRPW